MAKDPLVSRLDKRRTGGAETEFRGGGPIADNVHPLVSQLFEVMRDQEVTSKEIQQNKGVAHSTISTWRSGTACSLPLIDACFDYLGYELVAVPKGTLDGSAQKRTARLERCLEDMQGLVDRYRKTI